MLESNQAIIAEKLNFTVQIGSNQSSRMNSLEYTLPNSFPEDTNKNEIWPQIGEEEVQIQVKFLHLVAYISAFIHIMF